MSREAEGDLTTKEEEGDYQGKQRFEDTLQLVLKMGTGELWAKECNGCSSRT